MRNSMELPEETERNEGDLLYEHMSVLFVQKDMSSNMFFQAKTQFWSMIFQRDVIPYLPTQNTVVDVCKAKNLGFTSILKGKSWSSSSYYDRIDASENILLKEIEVYKPKCVVCIGYDTFEWLYEMTMRTKKSSKYIGFCPEKVGGAEVYILPGPTQLCTNEDVERAYDEICIHLI